VANRAMLLALDSADPPAEHHEMAHGDALLAANYSVPILWLSLFNADGLVTWPGIRSMAELPQHSTARLPGCVGRGTGLDGW